MKPIRVLLAVTVAGFVAGFSAVVISAASYVSDPFPVSSSAGRSVFTYNGLLVSYPYYEVGPEATMVGASIILIVGAVALGACLWSRRAH